MAVPVEPFAFYKDLGYNWEIIDWVAHASRRPVDLMDSLGWAPWDSVPLFYLNSYAGDALGIVTSVVFGNSWLAVKIVQALQVLCAFGGALALYRQRSASWLWAYSFALIYATMPATALTIRWNEDFGWIAALLPGAIAFCTFLIRRFGSGCIPLVGFICGTAGFVIALQYLAFVTLPLYALIILSVSNNLRRREWLMLVPMGALASLGSGAFFFLPSFVHPLFSDSVLRASTLTAGSFLGNFSEEWLGLLTLILREWYASPVPEFNVGSAMFMLVIPGVLLWIGASVFLAQRRRRREPYASIGVIVVVFACIALSLGTTFPFGQTIWELLFKIPHVNGIRTADRFMQIPELFITFWFVCGLEEFAPRARQASVPTYFAVLAVLVTGLAFDYSQHCFTVDRSKGVRQPQLDRVREAVLRAGGRVASFATVNGGALEDSSVYGRPAPVVAFADTDLGGRFLKDGIGGAGAFQRMGISNVISSPSWTYDASSIPSPTNVYRINRLAHTIFSSPEDVLVSRIAGRDMVSKTRIACTYGGPGAFDHLDAAPTLYNESFSSPESACAGIGLVDFDPRDLLQNRLLLDAWSAGALLPEDTRLRDIDYVAFLNRTLLNISWYRNSVDGDRTVFDSSGAVVLNGNGSISIPHHEAWSGGSRVQVRVAAGSPGTFALFNGNELLGSASTRNRTGFQWLSVPLRHGVPKAARLSMTYQISDQPYSSGVWQGIALDGIAVRAQQVFNSIAIPSPVDFVAASLDREREATLETIPPATEFAPGGADIPSLMDGFEQTTVAETRAFVPRMSGSFAQYRWNGKSGEYIIALKAVLHTHDSFIVIEAGRQRRAVASTLGSDTFAYSRIHLRHGDPFIVRYLTSTFDASLGDRITRISVIPVTSPSFIIGSLNGSSTLNFMDPFAAVGRLTNERGVRFDDNGAHGSTGSLLVTSFSIPTSAAAVAVSLSRSAGGVVVGTLRCGTKGVTRELDDQGSIALTAPQHSRCQMSLDWRMGSSVVSQLLVNSVSTSAMPRVESIWFPRGTFERELIDRDGTVSRNAAVTWLGCKAMASICHIGRSAYYNVSLGRNVRVGGTLILTSTGQLAKTSPLVEQISALRWNVTLRAPSDLVLAELYDGNWQLVGDSSVNAGEACDITATCFAHVRPGRYLIVHRYPRALSFGLAISIITLLFSAITAVFQIRRQRICEGAQHCPKSSTKLTTTS